MYDRNNKTDRLERQNSKCRVSDDTIHMPYNFDRDLSVVRNDYTTLQYPADTRGICNFCSYFRLENPRVVRNVSRSESTRLIIIEDTKIRR